jgi:thymidine kinase
MKINFCSAPCGSGKTRQMVQQASHLVERNEKVLILQPTRSLIDNGQRRNPKTRTTTKCQSLSQGNNWQKCRKGVNTLSYYVFHNSFTVKEPAGLAAWRPR